MRCCSCSAFSSGAATAIDGGAGSDGSTKAGGAGAGCLPAPRTGTTCSRPRPVYAPSGGGLNSTWNSSSDSTPTRRPAARFMTVSSSTSKRRTASKKETGSREGGGGRGLAASWLWPDAFVLRSFELFSFAYSITRPCTLLSFTSIACPVAESADSSFTACARVVGKPSSTRPRSPGTRLQVHVQDYCIFALVLVSARWTNRHRNRLRLY